MGIVEQLNSYFPQSAVRNAPAFSTFTNVTPIYELGLCLEIGVSQFADIMQKQRDQKFITYPHS